MAWWQILLVVLAIALVIVGFVAILDARRLDRLHVTILKSRAALEQALVRRAQVAREVGTGGVIDMAGAVVLVDAADRATDLAMIPAVDEGLGAIDDAAVREAAIITHSTPPQRRDAESQLSRALRLTVDEIDRSELTGEHQRQLEELDRARLDVRLTRSFHNNHVSQAQRLRRSWLPRVLHLAGSAPEPQTVDIDDE